ncbi:MAG: response regulator transcription factor [Alphaproteobacteria bacterium]|nr:response regulator transcription factor [Alphaproteobacteria bacterium]
MRILVVEDDTMIGEGLQKGLKQSGYAVDWVQDGRSAALAIVSQPYDLMILDLGLPEQSGMSVLQDMRKSHNDTPVLILTARDGIHDKVSGLDSGADDYMLKPFALEELEARIRMITRRKAGHAQPVLKRGAISLNPATHEVFFKNAKIALSGREFSLLHDLMKRPGAVLSKDQLEESLYGWNEEISSNAIEVHIHQIRKKMGNDVIKNIRNVGYTLQTAEKDTK